MRITMGVIALNEEEYLGKCLEQHYPLVDRIVVVEGADTLYPKARVTKAGLSTDATAEIVRGFPDPDGKLKFVQHGWTKRTGAHAKCELRNRYMEGIEPGLLIVIDADEFYLRSDLSQIIALARSKPHVQSFAFHSIHFWRNVSQFITGGYYNVVHTRFWRVKGNERYARSHNVPERNGQHLTKYRRIRGARKIVEKDGRFFSPSLMCYHMGFCKSPENTRDKTNYYLARGEGRTHRETTRSRAAWFGDDNALPRGLKIWPYGGPLPEALRTASDARKPLESLSSAFNGQSVNEETPAANGG